MDNKSDLIREDIDETRSALTEKLETLEGELRSQVESAKSSVEGTIENVRSTLKKLTPSYQVEEHPFLMLGGAVATGFLVGRALKSARASANAAQAFYDPGFVAQPTTSAVQSALDSATRYSPYEDRYEPNRPSEARRVRAPRTGPNLWDKFSEEFADEIKMVKGMALGAVINTVADVAKRSFPQIESQIEQVIESAKRKVGAPETEGEEKETRKASAEPVKTYHA